MMPHCSLPKYFTAIKPGIIFVVAGLALLEIPMATCPAAGTKPPASGELYNFDGSAGAITSDTGVTVSVANVKGAKKAKVTTSNADGYPGINFPVPAGAWNLSDFTGMQVEVTNSGADMVTVNMKAENQGDWHVSPWSVDMVTVAPGATQTLKVVFGQNFNHPAFALDKAHVTGVRVFVIPSKSPVSFVVSSPKLFKDADYVAPTAAPAVAAVPAPPPPPPPPPKPKVPLFPPTPVVDITGKHDFPNSASILDDASTQLKGLCSLSEFRALPEADRHVYSFEMTPDNKDTHEAEIYPLNFHLGTEGVTSQKVTFLPDGDVPFKSHVFTRITDPASKQSILNNFGNLDWFGISAQSFHFNKPVMAFGVVLRSSGDADLRKFYWASATALNGYPISYTLADGTVINLGARDVSGAHLKAGDNFLGIIDRSGRGIISVSYTLRGLAGKKSQSISLVNLAFVTVPKPAVASVINLKSSCDFENPDAIAATPDHALADLASLEAFRFIVANHRYVYRFDTWPKKNPDLDSNTGTFSFDLKGNGAIGEKMTVTAMNAAKNAKLTQTTLQGDDSQPYQVLGGLGDLGGGAWAEQTFKFQKPVWGFGVTYRSPGNLKLGTGAGYPVSYTLSDGTVVNMGSSSGLGGIISAKARTFVGLIDKTDKGISSVTLRVQGTAGDSQPVYIEDLAFALAGPPPGNWKLTMDDEFNGNKLDPAHWAPGYIFPDVINNELQGFVPENVTVANGICTVKVEHRDCVNTDWIGRKGAAQKFASGNFTSYDKFTQTYGYFEARIKMPHYRGAGVWPAFWMLPDRGRSFPADRGGYRTKNAGMGSETDIFEFMPRWRQLDGRFPIHCGTIWSYGAATPQDPDPHGYGSFALDNDGWGPDEMTFPNLDTEFHTYGIYWSPERFIWYVDSKPIFRVKDPKNVADVPAYFLFNISLSANGWGKNPGGAQPSYEDIIHDMPNQMEIDYFRAYSGTLEEATPTPPSDLPVIRKYIPPPLTPPTPPAPTVATPAPATTPATNTTPAAPINSTITTPANG